jgi:outer membrane protein OmpA-like peptidoglycan-associated protein
MRASLVSALLLASLGLGAGCKNLAGTSGLRLKVNPKTLNVKAEVIQLKPGQKILFQTGSDEILPESFGILDELATIMEQNPKLKIRIEGHSDADGDEAANQKLSERRAASVRAYVTGKKIEEARITSAGCGENTPIADNGTDEGKQQNRRVEFVILKKGDEPTCKLYK